MWYVYSTYNFLLWKRYYSTTFFNCVGTLNYIYVITYPPT